MKSLYDLSEWQLFLLVLVSALIGCLFALVSTPEDASAQPTPCDIGCTQLDPASRYMIVVRPLPGDTLPDDWRVRLEIESEIRDCFQGAGFERGDVGVLFLDGFEIEIIQVEQ